MAVNRDALRQRALAKVKSAQELFGGAAFPGRGRPGLDFIALALQGKKVDFSKVIGMIDKMISQLGVEQADDSHKKEYCNKQFDFADDKKKNLEHSISSLETAIAKAEESIAGLKDDIKSLNA